MQKYAVIMKKESKHNPITRTVYVDAENDFAALSTAMRGLKGYRFESLKLIEEEEDANSETKEE